MQRIITLTTDEWIPISRVLSVARSLSDAAQKGALKGAVNTETDPGKALIPLLRDVDLAAREIPDTVELF